MKKIYAYSPIILLVLIGVIFAAFAGKYFVELGVKAKECIYTTKPDVPNVLSENILSKPENKQASGVSVDEAEGLRKAMTISDQHLREAIAMLSALEVERAKLLDKHPKTKKMMPGTSVVTFIGINRIWVKSNRGEPVPYKIGDHIPSAGRLLSINEAKQEATAELTMLYVLDKQPIKN